MTGFCSWIKETAEAVYIFGDEQPYISTVTPLLGQQLDLEPTQEQNIETFSV